MKSANGNVFITDDYNMWRKDRGDGKGGGAVITV